MTTTITLESIKAEHAKLADMIASFEKQQESSALFFPEVTIGLMAGVQRSGIDRCVMRIFDYGERHEH